MLADGEVKLILICYHYFITKCILNNLASGIIVFMNVKYFLIHCQQNNIFNFFIYLHNILPLVLNLLRFIYSLLKMKPMVW